MTLQHARNRCLHSSAAVLVFSLVYELFSHGVRSSFMLGALPCSMLLLAPLRCRPGVLTRTLWGSGLAALTAGCLFRGVLEIYGTTNRLCAVYWWCGALLCLAALAVWGFGLFISAPKRPFRIG